LAATAALVLAGCWQIPSAHTVSRNYSYGDAPVDPPGEAGCKFDDCVKGGELFKLYCSSCHNGRPLGERPFNHEEVCFAHMREQAYLTGKEYRQLIHFLRRWHDLGTPTPDVEPSPKKFYYSQPITELRKQAATPSPAPQPQAEAPQGNAPVQPEPAAKPEP
jgi:hypothetical protein